MRPLRLAGVPALAIAYFVGVAGIAPWGFVGEGLPAAVGASGIEQPNPICDNGSPASAWSFGIGSA